MLHVLFIFTENFMQRTIRSFLSKMKTYLMVIFGAPPLFPILYEQ